MVAEGGGEVRQVTDLKADNGFNSHRHPQFMPDGRHYIYFARGHGRAESIAAKIVSLVILLVGAMIAYRSARVLIIGAYGPVGNVALVAACISIVVKEFVYRRVRIIGIKIVIGRIYCSTILINTF